MKTPILSATLAAPTDAVEAITSTLSDIAEAGRVTGPLTVVEAAAGEGEADATVTVTASELGEPPAKKPKA